MSATQIQESNITKDAKMADVLKSVRGILFYAAGLSFFVNLLMLTGPLYMLQIYDRVLSSRSYETLTVITVLILGLFAAMALIDFARGALLARAGAAFENDLKSVTFDFAMDVARAGSANLEQGNNQTAEQPLKDLRQVRQFLGGPGLTAVFDAPWTPFFIVIIFLMHPLLGWVAIAGLIILLVLVLFNEFLSRDANQSAQMKTAQSDNIVLGALKNAAAADAMGMRKALKNRWYAIGRDAAENSLVAADRIGVFTATTKAVRLFLQSVILGTGAFLAIQGIITPGVMIAASIIAGRALAPIEIVTGQWKNFALTNMAYQRLRKFIGGVKEIPTRTSLPAPVGALNVDNLFCQPNGAKKPVLNSINFSLQAGEVMGIIGPSAAGKSTLARALVGVEDAISGEVRLDGATIAQWDRDELGVHLGYLPQEVELFSGTAAANISRFSEQPDDEAIIAAAKAAGAHEMILGFDEGYDTEIGDRGHHISAGQRQRLALARALYGYPSFVVLDEPNANLDAQGDSALANAVLGLTKRGATTVIVAHRPNAIAYVDKLLLLADGGVQAFGPRDEVLQILAPKKVAPFAVPQRTKEKSHG